MSFVDTTGVLSSQWKKKERVTETTCEERELVEREGERLPTGRIRYERT